MSAEEARHEALVMVGFELSGDAVHEKPRVREDTGFLRGSWYVRVDGKVIATGEEGRQGVANSEGVRVGFDVPYAFKAHENYGPPSEDAPGSGGGFLSKKIDNFSDKYAEIFADVFLEKMGWSD